MGLKHWIKGANLDAPYINNFLSFSARKHVKIPNAWIEQKQATLEKICKQNKEREQANLPLITKYEGVDVGTVFDFSLVQKVIDKKLEDLMGVMGGEGKNQGKTFFTRTILTEHGIEEWKIEDIPNQLWRLCKVHYRIRQTGHAGYFGGQRLDPAISNVGNEGVFNEAPKCIMPTWFISIRSTLPKKFAPTIYATRLGSTFPSWSKTTCKWAFAHRPARPAKKKQHQATEWKTP